MKTHCPRGHEYARDEKGHARCSACDRERYRKKHPYKQRAAQNIVNAVVAQTVRNHPEKYRSRRIKVYNPKTGETIRVDTYDKFLKGMLTMNEMEFDLGPGVRPKTLACAKCHKPFEVNTQGYVALVCLDGCDRKCHMCKKEITVKSARWFAKQLRKPVCRVCADMNRPKVTHCHKGHEFTPENTLESPSTNQRFCRTCKRERMRKARSSKKEQQVVA